MASVSRVANFDEVMARLRTANIEPCIGSESGRVVVGSELTALVVEQANPRIERRTDPLRHGFHVDSLALLRGDAEVVGTQRNAASIHRAGNGDGLSGRQRMVRLAAGGCGNRVHEKQRQAGHSVGRDEPDSADANGGLRRKLQFELCLMVIGVARHFRRETSPEIDRAAEVLTQERNGG